MSRLDDIAGAFLRYLYQSSQYRPEVAGFLAGPYADGIDPPVTVDELSRVLTWLRSCELVAASDTPVEDLPLRAGLTGSGLICAGPYQGDVHAWRGAGPRTAVLVEQHDDEHRGRSDAPEERDETVQEDHGGEIISPRQAPETTTRSHPELSLDALGRVARVLLLTLPSIDDEQIPDQRVRRLAHDLLSESRSAEPDEERVRALATTLRSEISTGPVAGTLGVVLLDGIDEALGERHPSE